LFSCPFQYPALKPKQKFRLQPYVPRVFGYKIRQQGLEDSDKSSSKSKKEGKTASESKAPRSPSTGGNEAGPVITVLEENAKLKQEILSLKKMIERGSSNGGSKQ